MTNLFLFNNYRHYLLELLGKSTKRTGQRMAVAKAIGCHTTYVSQVLNGRADLSLEQATHLNKYFGHSKEESHYFLLLVQLERSGNSDLQNYFKGQISEVKKRRKVIKDRLKEMTTVNEAEETKFYSTWLNQAVQTLLTIPELQHKKTLAGYLRISESHLGEILEFLMSLGLIEHKDSRYINTKKHFHLGKDSPNINKHHYNWRLQTLNSLNRSSPEDIHYSAIVTMSRADSEKVRENLLKCLEENLAIIKPSIEEEAFVYCFDFFGMNQNF